jgi:phytoene synthase
LSKPNFSPEEIKNSYDLCGKIAASSRSSFYWAFSLLPPVQRRSISAIYAFARLLDDWGEAKVESEREASAWKALFGDEAVVENHQSDPKFSGIALTSDPARVRPGEERPRRENQYASSASLNEIDLVGPALLDTIDRFQIPVQYFHELIDAVAGDRVPSRIICDEIELDKYCYGVAGTVGLICIRLWAGDERKVFNAACCCGRAFQITNILRDVKEDAERSRIYVPTTLLDQFNIDQGDWLRGAPPEGWTAAVEQLIDKARKDYLAGWSVFDAVDNAGRRMFSLIWHSYRYLLEQIASDPEVVWRRRERLSRLQKLTLYGLHAFTPCFPARNMIDG